MHMEIKNSKNRKNHVSQILAVFFDILIILKAFFYIYQMAVFMYNKYLLPVHMRQFINRNETRSDQDLIM